MAEGSKDHFLAECEKIEENCLYTAQTHFVIAAKRQNLASGWLVLLPSVVSALSGFAVAIGAKPWIGSFAAIAGVVAAVATFLGIGKEASAHETAGKLLTQLRDEARALRETYSHDFSAHQLSAEVRAIGTRYRAYVASLPLTDDASFEVARKKVKSGAFTFDSARAINPPGADRKSGTSPDVSQDGGTSSARALPPKAD